MTGIKLIFISSFNTYIRIHLSLVIDSIASYFTTNNDIVAWKRTFSFDSMGFLGGSSLSPAWTHTCGHCFHRVSFLRAEISWDPVMTRPLFLCGIKAFLTTWFLTFKDRVPGSLPGSQIPRMYFQGGNTHQASAGITLANRSLSG